EVVVRAPVTGRLEVGSAQTFRTNTEQQAAGIGGEVGSQTVVGSHGPRPYGRRVSPWAFGARTRSDSRAPEVLVRLGRITAAIVITGTNVAAIATPAAYAENVITVTTVNDVVAADGVTSLREAFGLANGDGQESRIVLGDNVIYRL